MRFSKSESVFVQVEFEASEVVENLDGAARGERVQRVLTKLAADALALADGWERGKVMRAEAAHQAEALAAGYREVL